MRGIRGSVLAIALLIIAALSATAVALANYLSTETRLMRYHLAKAQARAIAKGGVILAMVQLAIDSKQATAQPAENYDWVGDNWNRFPSTKTTSSDTWEVALPSEESLKIRLVDEERKLNVNKIEDQKVGSTVKGLLNNNQLARELITDYIDTDSTPQSVDSIEEAAGAKPYKAKNAPLIHLEEVLSIPKWQELPQQQELTKRLLASTTTTPITTVNINTASREVLEAVGLTTVMAQDIVAFCQRGDYFTDVSSQVIVNPPTQPVPFDPGSTEWKNVQPHLGVTSTIFTVRVDVTTSKPVTTSHMEVVVSRKPTGPPLFKVGGADFQVVSSKEL